MYDELVERLRFLAKQGKRYGMAVVSFQEAADAIEELSREYESLAKTVNETAEWLHNRNTARWIPVTERLPEEWKTVLTFQPTTTDDKGIIQTCVYIGIPGKWRQAWNHEFLELPVTHWMPLPEPPKGETDG